MTPRLIPFAAAAALALTLQPALADPARRAAHEQLRQDRMARHEAREKVQADRKAGDHDALARDRLALDAAKAKVEADKARLKALRGH